jgi:hypothetical protein
MARSAQSDATAKPSLRALIGTVLGCAIVSVVTWPVHGGFILWIAALPLGIWFAYSGYVIWRYPSRRRLQTIEVILWLGVIACASALHRYYSVTARAEANQIVQAVSAYKRQHGVYPELLKDAGIALDERGGRWHIGYLVNDDRTSHSLFYPTTFTVFEAYSYEFEQGRWVYLPD